MSVYRVGNKSSNNSFPIVNPTLDLDFANSKTLDPRITFTRSSGGSYVDKNGVIKYAGVNEPRFDHDPLTGECKGLLLEESRTNSLTNSVNYGVGGTNQDIFSTIISGVNFFSDNNVIRITPNARDTNQHSYNFPSPILNTKANFSIFAKMDGYRYMWIRSDGANGGAVFDLQNGATSTTVNGSSSITFISNGWYRCSFTGAFSIGANIRIGASINTGFGFDGYPTTGFSGDGISSILISSAQLEVGSFPSSYIPTIGSARTRAADSVQLIGNNFYSWYNTEESTILTNFYNQNMSSTPNFDFYLSTLSNSQSPLKRASSRIAVVSGVTKGLLRSFINNGTTSEYAVDNGVYSSSLGRAIMSYKLQNDFAATFNGLPVQIDDSGRVSNLNFDRLSIGSNADANGEFLNGHISRLAYWPKRLTNEQLKTLTL